MSLLRSLLLLLLNHFHVFHRQIGLKQSRIAVELHLSLYHVRMVNHRVVMYCHITWVFPLLIDVCQSFVHFTLFADLLDQIINIKHKNHLALAEALRAKLIRAQLHFVVEMLSQHTLDCFEELGLSQVLSLTCDSFLG